MKTPEKNSSKLFIWDEAKACEQGEQAEQKRMYGYFIDFLKTFKKDFAKEISVDANFDEASKFAKMSQEDVSNVIDKLAGEKLTGKEQER